MHKLRQISAVRTTGAYASELSAFGHSDRSGWYMPCLTSVDCGVAKQHCCTARFSLSCVFSLDDGLLQTLPLLSRLMPAVARLLGTTQQRAAAIYQSPIVWVVSAGCWCLQDCMFWVYVCVAYTSSWMQCCCVL
jgi:hypothetical protein